MKRLLLGLFLLLMTTAYGYCSIKITPTYVELDANKTKNDYITGSFNVRGGKGETVRFKVYPEYFDVSHDGKLQPTSAEGKNNSLVKKVKFFPSEFTSKEGKNQKVRFTIMNLKSLPEGESRLVFFLEDVNTREVFIKSKDDKYNGKILVKTRVGVPVYVDKGKYIKKGSLDRVALKVDKGKYICQYKISGLGNSKIRYRGKAQLIKGKKLVSECVIPGRTVAGNSYIEVGDCLDLKDVKLNANEQYKLRIVLKYKNEKEKEKYLTKEIMFTPSGLITNSI